MPTCGGANRSGGKPAMVTEPHWSSPTRGCWPSGSNLPSHSGSQPTTNALLIQSGAKQPIQRAGTKQSMLIALLQGPEGATMDTIMAATGWQSHTVRGAMSGALGKKLGLVVTSAKEGDGERVYRISPGLA